MQSADDVESLAAAANALIADAARSIDKARKVFQDNRREAAMLLTQRREQHRQALHALVSEQLATADAKPIADAPLLEVDLVTKLGRQIRRRRSAV